MIEIWMIETKVDRGDAARNSHGNLERKGRECCCERDLDQSLRVVGMEKMQRRGPLDAACNLFSPEKPQCIVVLQNNSEANSGSLLLQR